MDDEKDDFNLGGSKFDIVDLVAMQFLQSIWYDDINQPRKQMFIKRAYEWANLMCEERANYAVVSEAKTIKK